MGSLITVVFNMFSLMFAAHKWNSGFIGESVKQNKELFSHKSVTPKPTFLTASILECKWDRLFAEFFFFKV